jgi:hypothetical protein
MALVATLGATAIALVLAVAGLGIARSDLVQFANLRDGTATYFRTHGALVEATGGLPAGHEFDPVLRGRDGIAGTADDGSLVESVVWPDCTATALDDVLDGDPLPFVDDNQRIHVLAECSGNRGARRRVEGILGRTHEPFVPAALYVGRPVVEAGAPVTLDGADHLPGDPPGHASGGHEAVAAAASPGLDGPLPLPLPVGDPRRTPVALAPAPAIDADAFSRRARTQAPSLTAVLPAGALPLGFGHTTSHAHARAATRGSGLLVVDGDLRIDASVEYDGVLVVRGTLRIGAGGALAVRGWLWVQGQGAGPAIRAEGPLSVVYSHEAIREADALLPLPRRALLLSEREVF